MILLSDLALLELIRNEDFYEGQNEINEELLFCRSIIFFPHVSSHSSLFPVFRIYVINKTLYYSFTLCIRFDSFSRIHSVTAISCRSSFFVTLLAHKTNYLKNQLNSIFAIVDANAYTEAHFVTDV